MDRKGIGFLACAGLLGLGGCASLDPVPPNLDFGEMLVGFASAPKSVAWKNNDGGFFSDMADVRAGGRAFELVSKPPPMSVPLGTTTPPASIRFVPPAAGPFAGRAVPYSELGIPGIDVRLTGIGVAPVMPESPDLTAVSAGAPTRGSLDFGDIPVGTRSYRNLTLRNPGATARVVTLSYSALFSAAFMPTGTPLGQVTVPAGSSASIVIGFAPQAPGSFADQMSFSTPSGDGVHFVLRLAGKAHKG